MATPGARSPGGSRSSAAAAPRPRRAPLFPADLLGLLLRVAFAFRCSRARGVIAGAGVTAGAGVIAAALLVGVAWMAGVDALVELKVNLLNFVALPITFGTGVDWATSKGLCAPSASASPSASRRRPGRGSRRRGTGNAATRPPGPPHPALQRRPRRSGHGPYHAILPVRGALTTREGSADIERCADTLRSQVLQSLQIGFLPRESLDPRARRARAGGRAPVRRGRTRPPTKRARPAILAAVVSVRLL